MGRLNIVAEAASEEIQVNHLERIQMLGSDGNWIERGDAAKSLSLIAREATHALRKASTDSDQDVSSAAKKALELLEKDSVGNAEEVDRQLADSRRQHQKEIGWRGDTGSDEDSGSAATPSSEAEPPDPAQVQKWLESFAEETGSKIQQSEDRIGLEISLAEGRRQKVFVDLDKKDSSKNPVILIYTVCGPANENVYKKALQSNAKLSHAAFALLDSKGKTTLIMVSRRRLDGLNAGSLADDVLYVARKGDDAEKQLHGEDKH